MLKLVRNVSFVCFPKERRRTTFLPHIILIFPRKPNRKYSFSDQSWRESSSCRRRRRGKNGNQRHPLHCSSWLAAAIVEINPTTTFLAKMKTDMFISGFIYIWFNLLIIVFFILPCRLLALHDGVDVPQPANNLMLFQRLVNLMLDLASTNGYQRMDEMNRIVQTFTFSSSPKLDYLRSWNIVLQSVLNGNGFLLVTIIIVTIITIIIIITIISMNTLVAEQGLVSPAELLSPSPPL